MLHDGYKYSNNGKRNGIRYYKCSKASLYFCDGSIKKLEDGSIIIVKEHNNHNGQDNVELVNAFRDVLKTRAKNENQLLKNIYDEECQRHNVAAALYPWKTAESIMRHARRNSLPRTPTSLNELAAYFDNEPIPRFLCCTSSMFRGSVTDALGNRSVIFACPLLIRAVQENNIDEIHADATFKIVPRNLGTQLLSIHCMIQNYSIPIIYVLMESKCRDSYDCVLAFVKNNLIPNLTPSTIITDYEPALRDALVSQFPGAQAHGCWFHHNQAVWKNMKSRGYLQHVNTNPFALESLKMLFSLPLLPAREMERGFALIRAFAANHGVHMDNLFDYYNRYWLQRVGPDIVSVHRLPRRTNNNLESFHNALRLKFSVAHPNLWIFLGHLCDLSKKYHTVVGQLGNNLQPTRNLRANFLQNSRNIKHATDQYNLGLITIWEYIKKCSYLSASYELRQRNWALGVGRDEPDHEIIENPGEEIQNNEPEEINNQPPPHDPNPLLCMTCLTRTIEETPDKFIVLPCGHAWICGVCVEQLQTQIAASCPMCRCENVTYQRIFIV